MGANAAMRQLSFAQIDLLLHVYPQKFIESGVEKTAEESLKDFTHKYTERMPTILPRFTHIFGDPVGFWRLTPLRALKRREFLIPKLDANLPKKF